MAKDRGGEQRLESTTPNYPITTYLVSSKNGKRAIVTGPCKGNI